MFTKKQRSCPVPTEGFRSGGGSTIFDQKPEKAAADGSVRQTVSGTRPRWLLPPNVLAPPVPLRPPGGQAA